MFGEWMFKGKPSMLGAASGAVAGLVAITPAAGFVGIHGRVRASAPSRASSASGASTGSRSCSGTTTRSTSSACTRVGGILGALLTGVFNSPDLGGPGFYNNWFETR